MSQIIDTIWFIIGIGVICALLTCQFFMVRALIKGRKIHG